MVSVTIAPPQSGAGLTLFPLVARAPAGAEYDLLPDALEAGSLIITEVGEQGTVPELLAINEGPRDVLVLDGMQLIGAKSRTARSAGRSCWPRRGNVFDALDANVATNGATAELAQSFLDGMRQVERRPLPTVGRGEYRSLAGAVVGGELELDGRVVHLSAFPA